SLIRFLYKAPSTTELDTLSLHDALPISSGAIRPAGLGLVPEHVRANKRSKHVGGRIGAEQHRPAILLFDDGCVAQSHESVEHLLRLAEQRVVARQGFEGGFRPVRVAG